MLKKPWLGGFAEAAEKLSQLVPSFLLSFLPSFPSRLINGEIALEVAAMTKRLLDAALMLQRALYRSRILYKTFPII